MSNSDIQASVDRIAREIAEARTGALEINLRRLLKRGLKVSDLRVRSFEGMPLIEEIWYGDKPLVRSRVVFGERSVTHHCEPLEGLFELFPDDDREVN